ncbi:MAG: MGMT family protein [Candidatus Krumholzibacteriia bacterium]
MARYAHPPQRQALEAEIWDLARRIPRGRVTTYGRLAGLATPPDGLDPAAYRAFGARWAGGALAHCPGDVPWWRVVNAQGRISAREGAERQRRLLEAEDVAFDRHGRIDLDRYGWPLVADPSGTDVR